jgi:CubicO group peptidase (beta-lactamase class C family)
MVEWMIDTFTKYQAFVGESNRLRPITTGILVLWTLFFSCADRNPAGKNQETDETWYLLPAQLDDGWEVARLSDAGLDPDRIGQMIMEIEGWESNRFNSILIVKDGKLTLEKYYPGHLFDFNIPGLTQTPMQYDAQTRHFLASQSKSITSLLFGIALDQGLVNSVDEYIKTCFDSYSGLFQEGKELITIRHLLTMSSGLPWNESIPGTDDVYTLFRVADPISYLLSKPLDAPPGQVFHYNSGGTNLLGEIVHLTSEMNLRQFAAAHLFAPLGITSYDWKTIRGEVIFASGGLFLKPRDLAKIGQLCLAGGEWNGKPLVSKAWLDESTRSWIFPTELGLGNGYGYQWWLNDFTVGSKKYHAYFAAGWGEQLMYIFPEVNMVVLFFGEYYTTAPQRSIQTLIREYILPSIIQK